MPPFYSVQGVEITILTRKSRKGTPIVVKALAGVPGLI